MRSRGYVFLLFFLLCLPAFSPPYISTLQSRVFANILNGWTFVATALLIIMAFKREKFSMNFIYFFLFMAIYCLETYLNIPSNLNSSLILCARSLNVVIFFTLMIKDGNSKELLEVSSILFKFLIICDILSVIFGSQLGYTSIRQCFFGLANYSAFNIVPMIALVMFDSVYRTKKIGKINLIIFFTVLAVKFHQGSTTFYLALLFAVIMYYIGVSRLGIINWFSPTKLFLSTIVMVPFVAFKWTKLFTPFLALLGKDATFSYRTQIWSKTILTILNSPLQFIFGVGNISGTSLYFQKLVGLSQYDTEANHAHNGLLVLLTCTGIVGTIIFGKWFFKACNNLFNLREERLVLILLIGFETFIIISFSDFYIFVPQFFAMLIIGLNIRRIMGHENEKNALFQEFIRESINKFKSFYHLYIVKK